MLLVGVCATAFRDPTVHLQICCQQELVAMYGHGVDEKVLEAEARSSLSVKDIDKAGRFGDCAACSWPFD